MRSYGRNAADSSTNSQRYSCRHVSSSTAARRVATSAFSPWATASGSVTLWCEKCLPRSPSHSSWKTLPVPFGVDTTTRRYPRVMAGTSARHIARASWWNANSSRITFPENPRAVSGFAGSPMMRLPLGRRHSIWAVCMSKRVSRNSAIIFTAERCIRTFSIHSRLCLSPRERHTHSAPGRSRQSRTAMRAAVKDLPHWRAKRATTRRLRSSASARW